MKLTADYFITHLAMEEHIEGGYFKEIYQHAQTIESACADSTDVRCLSSTIYYLLRSQQVSKFHQLTSDELWFFHTGSPLLIHLIDSEGRLRTETLGLDAGSGQSPQIRVPAYTIFGAEVAADDSFTFVSCMVSPGFDYRDFRLFTSEELIRQFPQHQAVITRLNG